MKILEDDREQLARTEVPIITISGTFREEIKDFYGLPSEHSTTDVVFSRAHFSMALGTAIEAWGDTIQPDKAWIADPTNYVAKNKWSKVLFTEFIGKTLARQPLLHQLKDFLDRFGRNKLPILDSITAPLLYLTEKVQRPIVCFHIAAGNILVEHGKRVIQIITDPHVRPEYVVHAHNPNMSYCVFDERTKLEVLEVAAVHHIKVDPQRIIVTGPPIDPRIVVARRKKVAWRSGPLKLCITTGGLGTNKNEIRRILQQILPTLHHSAPYKLVVYAGTQKDIYEMVKELAQEQHIKIAADKDLEAPFRLLYHPQILEANELLIRYGFHWADGFITKPSGDMAYDAVASGCFLLTLQEWGVWEQKIRELFEQKDIAVRAESEHFLEQLRVLQSAQSGISWIERAMNHSLGIEKLFLLGNKKIIEVARK